MPATTLLVKQQESATILTPVGDLAQAGADIVLPQILQLLQEGKKQLVLDFREVTFLGSAGVRLLLMLAQQIRSSKGRAVLAGLSPAARDTLTMIGCLGSFEVYETVEEALKSFQQPPQS